MEVSSLINTPLYAGIELILEKLVKTYVSTKSQNWLLIMQWSNFTAFDKWFDNSYSIIISIWWKNNKTTWTKYQVQVHSRTQFVKIHIIHCLKYTEVWSIEFKASFISTNIFRKNLWLKDQEARKNYNNLTRAKIFWKVLWKKILWALVVPMLRNRDNQQR